VDPDTTPLNATEALDRATSESRRPNILRLTMAVSWTLVILMLCWIPGEWVQSVEHGSSLFEIPDLDKLVHWGIFVVFTLLWIRVGSSRWWYAWAGLGGLALASISEIVQNHPMIGRDGSLDDAITDIVGVLIGLAVAPWVVPMLNSWESRLFRRSTS
jgi:hypothetical protein